MYDDQDKSLARNQLIAIILMIVFTVVWFQWFVPSPPPVQPAPPADGQQQTAQDDREPAGEVPGTPQAPAPPPTEWPRLPAPDTAAAEAAGDEIALETANMRLVFTRLGARLARVYIKRDNYGGGVMQVVPEPAPQAVDAVFPLGVEFTDPRLGRELNARRFEASVDEAARAVTFTYTVADTLRFTKRFTLSERDYVIETEVTFENLEPAGEPVRRFGVDATPAYSIFWAPRLDSQDTLRGIGKELMWRDGERGETLNVTKLDVDDPRVIPSADWMAVKSAYYVVAFQRAGGPGPAYARALLTPPAEDQRYLFGMAAPAFAIGPGEAHTEHFDVYVGPKERAYLAAAWPSLTDTRRYFSQRWNFMDRFAKFLLWMLNGFYAALPSYGIAIILLTLLVRGVMFPLTYKSMKSMKRMQKLAPELEALKEKHKDDQQEFQKQMMQLYREKGINPVSSCLPMLLQLPVFIALYRMLWTSYELRGAPFTVLKLGGYHWISDLSEPDKLLHLPFLTTVPFVGDYLEYINLLPILGGVAIWVSSKFMSPAAAVQSEQQKIITNIMPIFMVVVVYNMAAGLNLYILTSTVLGIAQNKLIALTKDEELPEKEKKTPKKRRNFYAAAQERKRRMAKEARQGKGKPAKNPRTKKPGSR